MLTLYYTAGLPTSTFFVYFVCDMKKYVSTCVLNKIAYHGIAVQPRVYGPHPQKLELPEVEKLKQRSVITERKQLPTYIAGVRCGPQPLHTTYTDDSRQQHKTAADEAQSKDFIWLIARQVDTENQIIPSWTGFSMNTCNLIIVSKDVVIMNQSNLMMEQLHLERIVVVMDQALYAKATEIAWKHREKYARIVLRMGTFHTIMTLLAIIGKRFQDAGLRDLCIESGIVAEGSVSGVMNGKMYNRAARTHKYIYEALMRLVWKGFIPWIEANLQHQLRLGHCIA